MNTSLFQIKQYFQYVFLSIAILSLTSTPLFAAQTLDQSNIKSKILVRDFKNYREFVFKGNRILISKNNEKTNLFFTNTVGETLNFYQTKNKKKWEFNKNGKNLNHNIIYSLSTNNAREIGYYFIQKKIYFKDGNNDKSCVNYKSFLNHSEIKNISKKIEDLQILNLLDENTCNKLEPKQKEDLENILIKNFVPSTSDLVKCLNRSEVQKIFDKDQFLQTNASAILARYFNFVDKVSKGETPLKIKCDLPQKKEEKVAQLDLTGEPPIASFDLKALTSTTNGKPKYNIDSVIRHELFHYGAQQYPLGQNQDCLDEKFADLFDSVCRAEDISKETVPLSSEILNLCSGKDPLNTRIVASQNMNTSNNDGVSGGTVVAEAQASAIRADLAQQEQTAKNLAATTNPADFVPVSSSEVKTLANSQLYNQSAAPIEMNYGEQQTIIATPEITSALDNVTSAFDKAASGMSRGLNNAIAMTVRPTQANQIRGEVDFSSQNTNVPVAQIVAEKYSPSDLSVPKVQTTSTTTRLSENSVKPTIDAAATLPAPSNEKAVDLDTKTTNQPGQPSAFASNTPATRNVASVKKSETIITETTSTRVNITTPTRTLASVAVYDNRALQNLTAFTQMNGDAYREVIKLYNDPSFEDQLDLRGISISIVDNQKKLIRHMGSKKDVKYNFIDDGKSLIKVETKK